MKLILAIAAGGAIGAVGRHYIANGVMGLTGGGFPFGILVVNILGSFMIGVLVEVFALVWSPDAVTRSFLVVGVLGALTTFSTFALDTVLLMQRGELLKAGLYVIGSVVVSIVALLMGMLLVRTLGA